MNTGFMIITNNPLVKEKLGEDYHVEYEELSYEDTLKKVQKMIFQGYRLLTHPLSVYAVFFDSLCLKYSR